MTDHDILIRVLRRESRSLLQYVRDSYPWASIGEAAIRDQLLGMAEREAETLARIARFLQARRVALPVLGPFPTAYTNCNFLSVHALIPRLIDDSRHRLAELDKDSDALREEPTRALVERLREQMQQHLRQLEELASTHSTPLAAVSR
jgi:hypothetical protein